jgi:flagellar motor protein MotB
MDGFEQRHDKPPANGNVTHYLALYLLLLAFFIVMTSVSNFEESRSRAVVHSVHSTFSAQTISSVGVAQLLLAKSGAVIDLPEIQDEFQRLVETEIAVIEIKKLEEGQVLELMVPVESLFADGETDILAGRQRLLERISAMLARRQASVLYNLDFMIGADTVAAENSDVAGSLAIARSGRFARALWEHGSPANAVSAGIRRSDPGKAWFLFYAREEEQSGDGAE